MYQFRYDYSKVMLMKLPIGTPDNRGGCTLYNTFAQALEKIKRLDAITLCAPKIIYLVGWQYNGHDDRYPEFFEVNAHAKRPEDRAARDSLLWLMREAARYHTTVSLHINLSDAYPESALWREYLEKNLILRGRSGRLKPTGTWNGRTAYQVRFAAEYRCGLFQRRVDRLLEEVPLLRDAGTIHVDAFFVRKGKETTIQEEKLYRRKMVEYFLSKGIDVTSEFIYRERPCGYRSLWGKSDTVGLIPAVWNLRMTQQDYLKYPPSLLAGGKLNDGLQWDQDLKYLFYGNTMGENRLSQDGDWTADFARDFSLESVPYLFLNQWKLERIRGVGKGRTAQFTHGVETRVRGRKILQNGEVLKEGETLCLPLPWQPGTYYAYSSTACERDVPLPFKSARISRVTPGGLQYTETKSTKKNRLTLTFRAEEAYIIREAENK